MREDLDLLNTLKSTSTANPIQPKILIQGQMEQKFLGKVSRKSENCWSCKKGTIQNSGNSQRKVKREKFLKIWGKQVLRISFSDIPPENAVPCIKENNLHQNFSSNEPPIDLGLSAGQGFCVVFLCKTLLIWLLHSLSQFVLGEVY